MGQHVRLITNGRAYCFLAQETSPSFLTTGWLQELICVWSNHWIAFVTINL